MTHQTPIESLFYGTMGVWSTLKTPSLTQHLQHRYKALLNINKLTNQNQTNPEILLPIYESLTKILSQNHDRLLLYLPSTLIPNHNKHQNHPIIENYTQQLKKSLKTILYDLEPRSNYTNGDETSQPELISPAAITARILVTKNILPHNWTTHHTTQITKSYQDTLQTTLPQQDTTNPQRNKWLKTEHHRLATKTTYKTTQNQEKQLSQNINQTTIQHYHNIITQNKKLNKIIYPIIILYGSKLKGYATPNSDTDTAILIRPNQNHNQNHTNKIIQNKLPKTLKIHLTTTHNNQLTITTPNPPQKHTANPYDTHILFNGIWIGDTTTKTTLCNNLLKPILNHPQPIKNIYTRTLEQDLLQYRLLHKGYQTHHPTTNPTYLDDGYRTLATKLYLRYIFLP